MAMHRTVSSILLATGVLLVSACASQPAVDGSLSQKYFEREANNYAKYQYEGQTVYCNQGSDAALIPYQHCKTEAALREMVETARRARNPPLVQSSSKVEESDVH